MLLMMVFLKLKVFWFFGGGIFIVIVFVFIVLECLLDVICELCLVLLFDVEFYDFFVVKFFGLVMEFVE